MPTYQFSGFLSVTIRSLCKVMDGQWHRSSNNFSLDKLQKCSYMVWHCPDGIEFDVKKDNTAAGDTDLTKKKVSNGSITEYFGTDRLYIANPVIKKGCQYKGKEFYIRIDAVGYNPYESWLYDLYGKKNYNPKISEINIPGTHDSGAINGSKWGDMWARQNVTITSQLEAGVRLLDIRLQVSEEKKGKYVFNICHGDVGKNLKLNEYGPFDVIFKECREFLCRKGSIDEFIIMSIKIDSWYKIETDKKKKEALKALIKMIDGMSTCNDSSIGLPFKNYSYKEARGHIIFINRIANYECVNSVLGPYWAWKDNLTFETIINNTNIRVQDIYKGCSASEKIEYLKSSYTTGADLYMNFCSGIKYKVFIIYPLTDFLNYIGKQVVVSETTKCRIGWILFDYILDERKVTGGKSLSAIDVIVDSNASEHQYYNYSVEE